MNPVILLLALNYQMVSSQVIHDPTINKPTVYYNISEHGLYSKVLDHNTCNRLAVFEYVIHFNNGSKIGFHNRDGIFVYPDYNFARFEVYYVIGRHKSDSLVVVNHKYFPIRGGKEILVSWSKSKYYRRLPVGSIQAGPNIFLCRVRKGNDVITGEIRPPSRRCVAPAGGSENYSFYEVLRDSRAMQVEKGYEWKGISWDHKYRNYLIAGRKNGIPTYIGRTMYRGTLNIGRIADSRGTFIVENDTELQTPIYEVLLAKGGICDDYTAN